MFKHRNVAGDGMGPTSVLSKEFHECQDRVQILQRKLEPGYEGQIKLESGEIS